VSRRVIYGSDLGSNYQAPGLKLSKQFACWAIARWLTP